jgi:iron complex transport system substrate-binding protein
MVRQMRAVALLAALAAAATVTAACGGARTTSAAAAREPSPITVAAANGEVTISQRPRRIVSLSPTATEDLFAIGAGRQVIAVDDQSNYPARAPRTQLSGDAPNPEAVAAYNPDLVVASGDADGLVRALHTLGIPVLVEPAAENLGQAYAQIKTLGVATGHSHSASALVARMRSRIHALVQSVPRPERTISVYHELSPNYYSATSKTFIGQIYGLFGLRNIADAADKTGSGYPQLSGEYVVAQSPDLIVLADTKCCHQSPQTVAARPGWDQIDAVKHGGVVAVSDDIASRWGPRVVAFVTVVAAQVKAVETGG